MKEKLLVKFIIISYLAVSACLSCTNTNQCHDLPILIHLNDVQNHNSVKGEIKVESDLVLIDTLPVISEMVDHVQIDNNCYVLDNNKALTCIDMKKGKIIMQKRKIGHSSQEWIQPIALTTDSSWIYLFDAATNKVITMDSNLRFKNSREMPCSFERFTKVEGGFLCYSEYRPAVHFITDSGKQVYTHYLASYTVDMSLKSNIFARDDDNNVYIKAEFSDTIFQWVDKECIPRYILDLGENGVPKDIKKTSDIWAKHSAFSTDFFVGREKLMFSYIEGREKRDICYSNNTGEISIISVDSMKNVPFIPQWKTGRSFYAIVNPDLAKIILKKPEMDRSILIKYNTSYFE